MTSADIRALAADDRFEAELIRFLVKLGNQTAGSSLSLAQADTLDATADGWDAIAQAVDDAVDNPDL